jgi:hypothetical protein
VLKELTKIIDDYFQRVKGRKTVGPGERSTIEYSKSENNFFFPSIKNVKINKNKFLIFTPIFTLIVDF